MPYGKHAGEELIDVPDEVLIAYWKEHRVFFYQDKLTDKAHELMLYIEDSFNESELR